MYVLTCQSNVQHFALPILIGLAAVGALLLFIVPPIAQPQWYHDFGDQRLLLGIPDFWNVISNLPFLIVRWVGSFYIMSVRSR